MVLEQQQEQHKQVLQVLFIPLLEVLEEINLQSVLEIQQLHKPINSNQQVVEVVLVLHHLLEVLVVLLMFMESQYRHLVELLQEQMELMP